MPFKREKRPYQRPGYVEYSCRARQTVGWAQETRFLWGVSGSRAFASVFGLADPGPLRGVAKSRTWSALADEYCSERDWHYEPGGRRFGYWSREESLWKIVGEHAADVQVRHLADWVTARFAEFDKSAEKASRTTE